MCIQFRDPRLLSGVVELSAASKEEVDDAMDKALINLRIFAEEGGCDDMTGHFSAVLDGWKEFQRQHFYQMASAV